MIVKKEVNFNIDNFNTLTLSEILQEVQGLITTYGTEARYVQKFDSLGTSGWEGFIIYDVEVSDDEN